jgi:NADH:ubiquinone oxidoreductase subunit B-like Fe-S oxidoreductase
MFRDSYNTCGPLDKIIPVDAYIPGCPPRPEAIIAGVVKLVTAVNAGIKVPGKPLNTGEKTENK